MGVFCEEAEAAFEGEVGGEEGEGEAVAEGEHEGIGGGGVGEEVAGVEGEGADEGEVLFCAGVVLLVYFHDGEADEGEAARADRDVGGAAEGLEAVGGRGGEFGAEGYSVEGGCSRVVENLGVFGWQGDCLGELRVPS